jgi:DNA-directed RNA polymerase subunit M/transcription elongation factor TFIIS
LSTVFCALCNTRLQIESNKIYNYDPIVFVEEIVLRCPKCGHEEKLERLRQTIEQI